MSKLLDKLKGKVSLEDVNKKINDLEKSIKTKEDMLKSGDVLKNPALNDLNPEFALMGSGSLASSLEKDKKNLEKLKEMQKEMIEKANEAQPEA